MKGTTDKKGSKIAVMTDIKEVAKRTNQLAYVALVFIFLTMLLYQFNEIYLSAKILGIVLICISICIWFNHKGYQKYTKPIVLTMLRLLVLVLCFSEGISTGVHLYYLPLLFALPLTTDSNKSDKIGLIYYFFLTCFAYCICVFYSPEKSLWQSIPDDMYKKMYTINSIGALIVSIIVVYFGLYFERKFALAMGKQIAKAENAMHIRTQFLSNMGHELRTPLNGISGIINLMQKEAASPGLQEYTTLLKYCSDQMLGLVNDVLDFNKIEAGKLELHPIVFNIKQMLQQTVLPFYYRFEEKNVALKVQLDNGLDENIIADDIRLVQVLNNLLSNALKFTSSGQVKLLVESLKKDNKTINVRFSVQDSGIGIDKLDQKRIFESFGQVINENTRRQEGAGLGLTISQRLLSLMDSKLEVNSEPGQGSTFFFTCSFNRTATVSGEDENIKVNHNLAGMQILVVEDNPINLMIVSKMLKDWNASVNAAVNGKLALEALASNAVYDLILLDLQMPEMDGYEAIVEIKKLYNEIPVFAFTASLIDNMMKNELIQLGFDDYITKPLKPAELYEKIKALPIKAVSETSW